MNRSVRFPSNPTLYMTPEEPSHARRDVCHHRAGTFAFVDEGTGPCITAIHGLPGSVRDFRWLAPAIGDRARFVRLDMPGFGLTAPTMGGPKPAHASSHVMRVLDHLGIESTVLIAHSFGATQAVAAAVLHPERIAGLALLSPVGFRPHRSLRQLPAPAALELGLKLPVIRQPIMSLLQKGYAAAGFRNVTNPEIERTLTSLNHLSWRDYRERVERVAQPTFCAWASDDRVIEPDISREVADALPTGPRLEFETGGHNIQKSRAVEIADSLVPWALDTLH